MVADGLTKALGPERHRKLAKRMGMGVWQKSGDYTWEITRIRSGSDERASSPVSPVTCPATCSATCLATCSVDVSESECGKCSAD